MTRQTQLILATLVSSLSFTLACDPGPLTDGGSSDAGQTTVTYGDAGDGGANGADSGPTETTDGGSESDADSGPTETTDGGSESDDGPADAGLAEPSDAGSADSGWDGDGPPDAGSALEELGTFDDPIVVDSFPFVYEGDTTDAPSDVADAYTPCAPATNESGGEFVFRVEVPDDLDGDRQLTVSVDDVSGDQVDIDVHLLEGASPDTCVDRNNKTVSTVLAPGDVVYVAADTWTNAGGAELAGPFELTFTLLELDPTQCLVNPIPSCDETTYPLVNDVPTEPPGVGGCPDGMVAVADFCVDRYEATLVEVLGDGTLAPFSPYENPGSTRVRAMSAPGQVPQGYISGVQAADACEEAGKRLCSNDEWLRACQGASGNTYPYGNSRQPGVCNDDRACHPAVQYFESGADFVWSNLGHGCINQLPASLDETGENAACTSEDGIFDMMGNLHEWTSDPTGIFRGGFYADTEINGEGCLYRTTAHNTSHWDYSTGFRCCADMP